MKLILLAIAAAIGYSAATIGMKLAIENITLVAGLLIIAGFYGAAHAEIVLMRGMDLGVIYLTIIATETVIVLCFSTLIGEGLNARELAGAALIFGGVAVVLT